MHIHAHAGSLARGAVIYYATVRRARVPSSPSPSSPSCGRVESRVRRPANYWYARARESVTRSSTTTTTTLHKTAQCILIVIHACTRGAIKLRERCSCSAARPSDAARARPRHTIVRRSGNTCAGGHTTWCSSSVSTQVDQHCITHYQTSVYIQIF